MEKSGIVQHFGVVVDFSKIKCMQVIVVPSFKYYLSIELLTRIEYIYNPGTETWEKEIFNDIINIDYGDYDMAIAYLAEWMDIWKQYKYSTGCDSGQT